MLNVKVESSCLEIHFQDFNLKILKCSIEKTRFKFSIRSLGSYVGSESKKALWTKVALIWNKTSILSWVYLFVCYLVLELPKLVSMHYSSTTLWKWKPLTRECTTYGPRAKWNPHRPPIFCSLFSWKHPLYMYKNLYDSALEHSKKNYLARPCYLSCAPLLYLFAGCCN